MTSKVSNQQILEKMEQGFARMDQRFEQVDQKFTGIDGRLDGIDGRLDRLEMSAADHDNKLATLVTCDQFSRFRVENMHFQHELTKKWEEAQDAIKDSQRLQRRLEIKVKSHEKVLKTRHLLAA